RAIRNTIETLGNGKNQAQAYADRWLERSLMHYTEATRRVQQQQSAYRVCKQAQQQNREAIEENRERLSVCEERRQQSHRELIQLEAQRQGVSALRDKDELERKITECNRQLGEKAR